MKRVKMGGKRIIALILAIVLVSSLFTTVFATKPISPVLTSTTSQTKCFDNTKKVFDVTWKDGNVPSDVTVYYGYYDAIHDYDHDKDPDWDYDYYTTPPTYVGSYNVYIEWKYNGWNYNLIEDGLKIINKETPTCTTPTTDAIIYSPTKTLANVNLITTDTNGTWAWVNKNIVPTVGNSGYEAIFTPTDTTRYNTVKATVQVIVNQATPGCNVPTTDEITYNPAKTLATVPLITTDKNGTWAWVNKNTVPTVGNSGYDAIFTPTDTKNYITVTKKVALSVIQATPGYNVPTTDAIIYDPAKTLDSVALKSTDTNGKWAWVNKNTVPTVGNSGYEAIFTPTDPNYKTETVTVQLIVNQAIPNCNVPTTDAITYDPAKTLASVDFNTTDKNGKWTWVNSSIVPTVGNGGYEAIFTPTDTINYKTVTKTVAVTVNQATPDCTTPTTDAITYSPTKKLATVALKTTDTNGTWAWVDEDINPTVGNKGYTAIFTPTDTTSYKTVKKTVSITVNKATPEYSIPSLSTTYDKNKTLADISLPTGWKWVDSTIVPTVKNNGYSAIFTPSDSINYLTVTETLPLTVNKAIPTPTIPTSYEAKYTSTLKLSDISLPTGWIWDNPDQLINAAKTYTDCKATYTQDNSGNYNTVSATVTVTVNKDTPVPTIPTGLEATYTPTLKLSDIALPTGWTWDNPDQLINEAKTYTDCKAIYTQDDSGNYNTVPATVTVIVNQADPNPTTPKIPDITYDPHITLASIPFQTTYAASGSTTTTSVPGKWSWDKPETVPTVGTNTYGATFTPTDSKNYKSVTRLVSLTVKAAATIDDSQVPHANLPTTDTTGSSNGSTSNGATVTIADNKVAKSGSPAKTSDANGEMLITSLSVLGLSAAGLTAILNKKKKDEM